MKHININKANNGNYYIVENKHDEDGIGTIFFFKQWKKWVFEPLEDTIYDVVCLNEISKFMEKL